MGSKQNSKPGPTLLLEPQAQQTPQRSLQKIHPQWPQRTTKFQSRRKLQTSSLSFLWSLPFLSASVTDVAELTSWSPCLFCVVVCGCLFVLCVALFLVGFLFRRFVLFAFFLLASWQLIGLCYWSCFSSLLKATFVKRDDVFALVHRICKYATSYRHDERPGESYEALDGKKILSASDCCCWVLSQVRYPYSPYLDKWVSHQKWVLL